MVHSLHLKLMKWTRFCFFCFQISKTESNGWSDWSIEPMMDSVCSSTRWFDLAIVRKKYTHQSLTLFQMDCIDKRSESIGGCLNLIQLNSHYFSSYFSLIFLWTLQQYLFNFHLPTNFFVLYNQFAHTFKYTSYKISEE